MTSGTLVPRVAWLPRVASWPALWRWVVAHRARVALAAITLAGLGLRLWGLASKSLWIDETFSIGMATQSWPSFLHTIASAQPNMELFYVLLKLAVTITPAAWQGGEFFWRLLPALAGAATIPALYALVWHLFPVRVALGAAALLAVNEFMVEYSQQARGYTLFVLLLTLSYLALVRWLAGSRRALAWFAALAALGFLTQAFEVIFLIPQVAFMGGILLSRRTFPWRAFLLALIPVGLVIALRYPLYAAHPDQVAWIARPSITDLIHGTRQLIGGDGGMPTRIGDLLLVVMLLCLGICMAWTVGGRLKPRLNAAATKPACAGWGGATGAMGGTTGAINRTSTQIPIPLISPSPPQWGGGRGEGPALFLLWFILPIAVTWIGSQVKPIWVTRYLAPFSVAACVIVAVSLHGAMLAIRRMIGAWQAREGLNPLARKTNPSGLWGQIGGGWQRWGYAGLMGLALCGWALPLHDYLARPGWEDWRGAAQAVNASYQAGDGMVCYDNQWGCDFGFSHYFTSLGGPAHLDPTAPGAFSWATYARADREAIFAQAVAPTALAPYLAAHHRIWVLLGHYVSGAGDWRAGLAWLNAHAHLVRETIFAGDIDVFLYETGGNHSYAEYRTGS